jgi:transcriptional regulator with XRE-family HTH domain
MATRESPFERARNAARAARRRLGGEFRTARRSSGLSQEDVAGRCHLSDSQVYRIERGSVDGPSLESIVCIAAVVGLDVVIRTYPRGDPIRDAGHRRLLERLRVQLHSGLGFRTEVPLPIAGDLRAWDALITGEGWQVPVEAETVLDDAQALERKIALKMRDGGFDRVILLVADTPRNRRCLRAAPLNAFPAATRAFLAALRQGADPGASGVVIL